jgi:hypothetical protein
MKLIGSVYTQNSSYMRVWIDVTELVSGCLARGVSGRLTWVVGQRGGVRGCWAVVKRTTVDQEAE